MSPTPRIAVAASLSAAFFPAERMELIRAETGSLSELQRQRWLRILEERRRREPPPGNAAALDDPAMRTLLLVLDGRADAVLLSAADAGSAAAWRLLEPSGNGVVADVWMGAVGEWNFGWLDAVDDAVKEESPALTAARLQAAAVTLGRAWQRAVQPLVVAFAGGPDPRAAERERRLATLRARLEVQTAALYSPLFYADGKLQTAALLEALRKAAGEAPPLLYIPRLRRAELESGLAASWCGPFRAGAEAPAALVPGHADAARLHATLATLAALSR